MMFQDFRKDLERAALDGIECPSVLSWDYRDQVERQAVKAWMHRGLAEIMGKEPQWLPEYEQVVDWLRCNHGRGLILSGDCGLGKTLITAHLIPVFLHRAFKKIATVSNARGLKALFKSGRHNQPIQVLDDVGEEAQEKDYGTAHEYFSELVDHADKRGALLVISTNLTKEELAERYGARTIDRLRHNCHFVALKGKSMRGKADNSPTY